MDKWTPSILPNAERYLLHRGYHLSLYDWSMVKCPLLGGSPLLEIFTERDRHTDKTERYQTTLAHLDQQLHSAEPRLQCVQALNKLKKLDVQWLF